MIKKDAFKHELKLTNQINSSAGSVMDNIAEGAGRGSTKEFIQFLGFAKGSCTELKSQLYRCLDRNLISKEEFLKAYDLVDLVYRYCTNLSKYLNNTTIRGEKFMNR